MKFNYCQTQAAFWCIAPDKPGYKHVYAATFGALMHLLEQSQGTSIVISYDRLNGLLKLSEEAYSESLKWLDQVGLLVYFKGKNRYSPGTIVMSIKELNVTERQVIDPDISDSIGGSNRVSTPVLPESESSPRVCARARSRSLYINKLTKPRQARTRLPAYTHEPGREDALLAGRGGANEENQKGSEERKKIIRIPTLRQRVDQFARDNPAYYPSLFYDGFVAYQTQPAKNNPAKQLWETHIEADGRYNLAGWLEKRWMTFARDFPGWVIGSGFPQVSQATGTYGYGYGQVPQRVSDSAQQGRYQVHEVSDEERQRAVARFVLTSKP